MLLRLYRDCEADAKLEAESSGGLLQTNYPMANLCLIYLSEVQKTPVPQHLSHRVQLEMAPVQYLKMAPVVQFLKRAPVVQFHRPVLPNHHRVYLKLAPVQFYQPLLYVNHRTFP